MAEPQSTLSLEAEQTPSPRPSGTEATSLRDLTPEQWKGGLAAWLGWLFDGLDMHLYTLVATPFVAQLLNILDTKDPRVAYHGSLIQAAFLFGWALGGGFFGIVGDKLGRTRALMLTILVYAAFTGLSAVAQTWWQLMIFRFIAALGIGGEWAVGASLLSETWPRRWRPWMAAVLQTGVNIGILLANLTVFVMANLNPRYVFLVGIAPALLVLWIRRAVPETDEWHTARTADGVQPPGIRDLFRGDQRRLTFLILGVCGLSLTAHWAVIYWYLQHLQNLPELADWTPAEKRVLVTQANTVVMVCSIIGNFAAAGVARWLGYRRAITIMCVCYFVTVATGYGVARTHTELWPWLVGIGIFQGVFALFTMYLPPLFPTLLRTTGAGFCYNFGRVAAAAGTITFGKFAIDQRMGLFCAGFLFLPAALIAWSLPDLNDNVPSPLHEPTE